MGDRGEQQRCLLEELKSFTTAGFLGSEYGPFNLPFPDQAIEAGISAIIKESIGKLGTADKINIYLNPKNSNALNGKFTGATVSVDEKLELGDFRLEWHNGFAERDVKNLWETVGEICSRHSFLEENNLTEQQTKGE